MPVIFSPQDIDSWPLSVQTAFLALKKAEYRMKKTKEFLKEVDSKHRGKSMLPTIDLKQLEMKQTELFQVWKSAMEDTEALKALEDRLADLITQDV